MADIEAKKTYRYDIAPDGTLAGKTLVFEQGSDGMTLDSEGNLYLTGDGVIVFDKAGRQIEHIEIPGALDGERLLRRQGQADALHHGQHGPLRDQDAREGGQRGEVVADGPSIPRLRSDEGGSDAVRED